MQPIVAHIKHNLVGYIALFVALGGTSYAAVSLPAGSVGTRQIRNGAVTPVKLDGRAIGGSVRDWAYVSEGGQVLGGSRGAHASVGGNQYTVTWGTRFTRRCAALVTPAAVPGIAPVADATGVGINNTGPNSKTSVLVWTYNNGNPTAAPFYIAIIC